MDWVVGVAYERQFEVFALQFHKSSRAEAAEGSHKDGGMEHELHVWRNGYILGVCLQRGEEHDDVFCRCLDLLV